MTDVIPVDTSLLPTRLGSAVRQAGAFPASLNRRWHEPRWLPSTRQVSATPAENKSSRDMPPSSSAREHGCSQDAAMPITTNSASSANDTVGSGTIGGHTKHQSDRQQPINTPAVAPGSSPGDTSWSSRDTCDESTAERASLEWRDAEEVEVEWELCEAGEQPDKNGICWEESDRDSAWVVNDDGIVKLWGVRIK